MMRFSFGAAAISACVLTASVVRAIALDVSDAGEPHSNTLVRQRVDSILQSQSRKLLLL